MFASLLTYDFGLVSANQLLCTFLSLLGSFQCLVGFWDVWFSSFVQLRFRWWVQLCPSLLSYGCWYETLDSRWFVHVNGSILVKSFRPCWSGWFLVIFVINSVKLSSILTCIILSSWFLVNSSLLLTIISCNRPLSLFLCITCKVTDWSFTIFATILESRWMLWS